MAGLAAGQICRPSEEGTARASPALHDSGAEEREDEEEAVLPAAQLAHTPEHAAEARPARSPYVPEGQSEQADAPASEKVPGEHGMHAKKPGLLHEPATHVVHAGGEDSHNQLLSLEDLWSVAKGPALPPAHEKRASDAPRDGGDVDEVLMPAKEAADGCESTRTSGAESVRL